MRGRRIGLVELSSLPQAPLAAGTLTRQEMAQVRALVLHSAVFGELETLGGAPRGFNLWHR